MWLKSQNQKPLFIHLRWRKIDLITQNSRGFSEECYSYVSQMTAYVKLFCLKVRVKFTRLKTQLYRLIFPTAYNELKTSDLSFPRKQNAIRKNSVEINHKSKEADIDLWKQKNESLLNQFLMLTGITFTLKTWKVNPNNQLNQAYQNWIKSKCSGSK